MTTSQTSSFVHLTSFQATTSAGFTDWLAEQNISIALTNTLGHRALFIGRTTNGRLSIHEQPYDRCMGLVVANSHTLYLVTRYQIWRLENALPPHQFNDDGYDRVYIPQTAYTTGVLNIHDIAITPQNQIYFVNTRFACLATISQQKNFIPVWKPPFISELVAEDRCHLNGLAMRDDKPAYMTCFSQTNTQEGWRDHRLEGGLVLDIATNQIIATGLTMPHSPRWYSGNLWLTNSGTGHFGRIDMATGQFEPIAFGAGFLRGLDFYGNYAVVGSSKPRHGDFFAGLPLHDNIQKAGIAAHRGFYVVDLRTGEIVHWFSLEGVTGEIYDVVVLPGVQRPLAVGIDETRLQNWVTIGPWHSLMKPT